MTTRPRVFIGSSSEGLAVAYALQKNLEDDGEVTVWTQDVFKPSEFILESLLEELDNTEIGIFVFSPDDAVVIRGIEQPAVRDNVIFEVGLYVGRLGRDRCFILSPKGGNPRLPSDLLGVNILNYDAARSDGRWDAALGPSSSKIRSMLRTLAPTLHPAPLELRVPILERRGMLSSRQAEILQKVEANAPVSRQSLNAMFPAMSASELHYRLEQLRLFEFVVSLETESGDGAVTRLHPHYEHARLGKRGLRTL